ncbi:MAG: hypothetical protein LUI87_02735 [Lachnospiraceae bacterium]|nr:hypothetical protein [Lachnospiraceae bacterium]
MNLVIVDADSKNSYTSEEISSLLGIADLTIWDLNDQKLADEEYRLEAVTGVPEGFSRVVLLTGASHGIMNYHKKMIQSNPMVKYWVVTLPDTISTAERNQISSEVSLIFQQRNARYAVLFDAPDTLKETASILKEKILDKPQCVLLFATETPVVANVLQALRTKHQDWDVSCNPESIDWIEKYADRVLLFAEDLEKFQYLAKINNVDRIYTWVEAGLGTVNQQKEKIENDTVHLMSEYGFSFTRENKHILCGFSQYELCQAEINSGAYSYTALKSKDTFVMWDEYGLPLLNMQYVDDDLKRFLKEQCVLENFIGE